ncbi:phage portal protein [Rhizobium sp. GN54]|uniref:phage portal protein n=1 Tax=Rhizobium sp. GN54 TaxID=2898150 RepID=UPI001E593533|nr:phage portal protein [Rhizobium sp. GN54]MCD2185232.1 phage portal protein [Rhizobium sp. GN54]
MWPFRRDRQTETATAQADEQRSLADPESWLVDLFGATPAQAGIAVTSTNATKCTAVRAAVAALSEASGQLPLHLFRRGENGARERDTTHPVAGLLAGTVNPWTTSQQLREQLVRDALLAGNGFCQIVRDGTGKARELHRLVPTAVQVEADSVNGEPVYRVTLKNGVRYFPFTDIIHLRAGIASDGVSGVSPVQEAREAIALALVMERHAAKLFGRGARPSGLLKFPNKLGSDTASRIKASWQAAHAGENSGGTAVLEEGGDFQSLTLNSVDTQFLELRKFAVEEIARAFRVSPVLIQDFGRATWSNSSEMGRQFLQYSLEPWLSRIEGEFALKLLSADERAELFIEFETDALTASDTAARATAYSQFRSAGVYTANELRRRENLQPLPGGDTLANPFTTSGKAGGATNE